MAFLKKDSKKKSSLHDEKVMLLSEEMPFVVREAYKALRTNVTFSLPGSGCKCVAITSAGQGDGKSTTIINLAISLAEADKKVVVVDGDMRAPSIASKLGVKGTPGLSDFLIGAAGAKDVIQTIDKFGIDVIAAGTVPPDSTRLLESAQFEAMIKALRKYYDYILVDLPPITIVPDAVIVSKQVDGYILAVRHDVSRYRHINEMLNQLSFVEANIIGITYTAAPAGRKKKYGYGYYH